MSANSLAKNAKLNNGYLFTIQSKEPFLALMRSYVCFFKKKKIILFYLILPDFHSSLL